MYYDKKYELSIFSKVAKLNRGNDHYEFFVPLDISDSSNCYNIIKSSEIYDAKIIYKDYCDRFEILYKLKSDIEPKEYSFAIMQSILMDIIQEIGIDKDGYIQDTEFCFAGIRKNYKNQFEIIVLPKKLSIVTELIHETDKYYITAGNKIEFKNIEKGDLVKIKGEIYYVFDKPSTVNVRTKKATSNSSYIKLETRPVLYMYEVSELFYQIDWNSNRNDGCIYLCGLKASKNNPLGKNSLILTEKSNIKSAMHYKINGTGHYYEKIFTSDVAEKVIEKIKKDAFEKKLYNLNTCEATVKSFLYRNISSKAGQTDFIDKNGYFMVGNNGLNDFKKAISQITTTKNTTKEIIEELAPYDASQLKEITNFDDLEEKIYIDGDGNPIYIVGKSSGILPEVLIKDKKNTTVISIQATDKIKNYFFYIKDYSSYSTYGKNSNNFYHTNNLYVGDFEEMKVFDYVGNSCSEIKSCFLRHEYINFENFIQGRKYIYDSLQSGSFLQELLKQKPIKPYIYKLNDKIELEVDSSKSSKFINLLGNNALSFFSNDAEELEDMNYLFNSGDNLESLLVN